MPSPTSSPPAAPTLQAKGSGGALLVGGLGTRSLVTRGLGNLAPVLASGFTGPTFAGGASIHPLAVGSGSTLLLGGLRSRALVTRGLGNFAGVVGVKGPGSYVAAPPALPVTLPTTLAEISAAIHRRILQLGLVASPCVLFSRDTKPRPSSGYPQIAIARGAFGPIDAHQTGGGRHVPTFRGIVRIAVNTLGASDEQGQDAIRLLGPLAPSPNLVGPGGSNPSPDGLLGPQSPTAGQGGIVPDPGGTIAEGLESIVHKLLDILTIEFIEDRLGNHLTIEPAVLSSNAEPVEYPDPPLWGGISISLRVLYLAKLGIGSAPP